MNKKAIFIDFGNHFKQQEHCLRLWSEYNPKILTCKKNKDQYNEVTQKHLVLLNEKHYEIKLYLYVIFFGLFYQKIVFVTGPEYDYSKGYKKSALDFLMCMIAFFYNDSLVVYIKNTEKFSSLFRLKYLISRCGMILCESEFQRSYASKLFPKLASKMYVSYVYYSDSSADRIPLQENNVLSVALIGQFDSNRRDYLQLISLLKKTQLINKIQFIQVGRYIDSDENHFLKQTLEGYGVKFLRNDFTNSQLDHYLSQVDCFLSLNKKSMYSGGKGTACFSEAIQHKKALIVPEFMGNFTEFSDLFRTYSSEKELISILESFSPIDNCFYDRFEAKRVRESILREGGVI